MDSESADFKAARLLTAFFNKSDRSDPAVSAGPLPDVVDPLDEFGEPLAGPDRLDLKASSGPSQRD